MPIGPQLPPAVDKRKRPHNDEDESSDSDDSVGPLPPGTHGQDSTVKKARLVGPALPPSYTATASTKDVVAGSKEEESSDDDDFGPSLPPPPGSKSESANETAPIPKPTSTAPPKVQRDEWMTMAPTSGDWSQRIDPTKLKNRKFNTGRSNNTKASSSGSDVWNETPDQKQARLRREVLGIKEHKGQTTASTAASDDSETARRIKEYNAQRGPSLYEAHQKDKTVEEDDPSARAFDREKDIGGGLINATKRREMVKKSSDFNSRFSSAKYL